MQRRMWQQQPDTWQNSRDIKVSASKRTLLVQASNFPLEVLYLRDDDIPQSVASGVADIGIVGENEFVERGVTSVILSVWRAHSGPL